MSGVFAAAPIIRSTGMQLTYDVHGRAVVDWPYRRAYDHGLGDTHGGLVATLLDTAGWFTLAPHYPAWINTVEFSVRLDEPVKNQALRAVGEPVRIGKKLAMAEMRVTAADGRLVARGAGTFAPTSLPIEPPRSA